MKKNLKNSKVMDCVAITIAVMGFCMLIGALSFAASIQRMPKEKPAITNANNGLN